MKMLLNILTISCMIFSIDAYAQSRRGGGKKPIEDTRIKTEGKKSTFSDVVAKIFPAKNARLAERISKAFESSKELRENAAKISEEIAKLDMSKIDAKKLTALQGSLLASLNVELAQRLVKEGKLDLNKESKAKQLVETSEATATKLALEILADKSGDLNYEQMSQHNKNLRLSESTLTNEALAIAKVELILGEINKSLTARGEKKITSLEELIKCLTGK